MRAKYARELFAKKTKKKSYAWQHEFKKYTQYTLSVFCYLYDLKRVPLN